MSKKKKEQETLKKPLQNRRLRGLVWAVTAPIAVCLVAYIGLMAFLSSSENKIVRFSPLDNFVAGKMEDLAQGIPFSATAGGIVKGSSFWNPAYRIDNLVIFDQNDRAVLELSEFELDFASALKRQISGQDGSFALSDTNIFITRDPFGRFNLGNFDFSEAEAPVETTELGTSIDNFAAQIFHEKLNRITLDNVTVFYSDQKTRTANLFTEGELTLRLQDNQFELIAGLREDLREGANSWVRFNLKRKLGGDFSDLDFTFERVDTQLIAQQFEPFEWLGAVEARASASFVAQVGQQIDALDIAGVVDLGEGKIKATETNPEADFEAIKAYFDYNATEQRFRFSQIQIDTVFAKLSGSGEAKLNTEGDALSSAAYDIVIDRIIFPEGENFERETLITGGVVKGEIGFEPLLVTIGEAGFNVGESFINLSGAITPSKGNWNSAVSAGIDRMDIAELVAIWPTKIGARTKKWIKENISSGWYSDAELRFARIDGKNDFDLTFQYADGTARVLKTAPPVQGAKGRGHLNEETFTAWVEEGVFQTDFGKINAAGSTYLVKDVTKKPADARAELKLTGPLQAGLAMLDIDKFQFLSKVGRRPDMATGQMQAEGVIDFVSGPNPPKGSATFSARAKISDFFSEELVKDQTVTADVLNVAVTQEQLEISGGASVSGVPADIVWTQALKDNPSAKAALRGKLTLSQDALKGVGIELPEGSFEGESTATLVADIERDQDAKFELRSDLVGTAVRIPVLGWRKSAEKPIDLTVAGAFGEVAEIDTFAVEGAGLTANGRFELNEAGALTRAEFDQVKVSGWFEAGVKIDMEKASTVIEGDFLDLRRLNLGRAKRDKAGPIDIRMRRVRLTDEIALDGFNGRLAGGASTKGNFKASINGRAAIAGQIYPENGQTRIDVTGNDAGRILSAANLLDSVTGGNISLTLRTTPQEGEYVAWFQARKFRLNHSNALAALMDGLSLVGLLQKLEGDGIYFDQARGEVRLTPNGAILNDVSVTGASMGMTLEGQYASANKALDFEGVLTPIYFLNGSPERAIGREFGTKKGSGLISMLYKIEGTAEKPKIKANPLSIFAVGPLKNLFRNNKKKKQTE